MGRCLEAVFVSLFVTRDLILDFCTTLAIYEHTSHEYTKFAFALHGLPLDLQIIAIFSGVTRNVS